MLLAEPLRERRLLRFGGAGATHSSPPLVCSPSASLILSPSRLSMIFRAANRSPPDTVLFLANLSGGGGVGDGDGNSYVSLPPVNLCIAIIRAAALFERTIIPFWSAVNDGNIGVGGEAPG